MKRTQHAPVLRVLSRALVVVVCVAGVLALFYAGGVGQQAQDAKALVRIYCNGAVSDRGATPGLPPPRDEGSNRSSRQRRGSDRDRCREFDLPRR